MNASDIFSFILDHDAAGLVSTLWIWLHSRFRRIEGRQDVFEHRIVALERAVPSAILHDLTPVDAPKAVAR